MSLNETYTFSITTFLFCSPKALFSIRFWIYYIEYNCLYKKKTSSFLVEFGEYIYIRVCMWRFHKINLFFVAVVVVAVCTAEPMLRAYLTILFHFCLSCFWGLSVLYIYFGWFCFCFIFAKLSNGDGERCCICINECRICAI